MGQFYSGQKAENWISFEPTLTTICFIFLVMKPYIFIAEKFAYQLWHF